MSKKTSKIALLFNTRNNYQLFEEIFFKETTVDFSNYHIFNIDLDSEDSQQDLRNEMYTKYNMTDIEMEFEKGLWAKNNIEYNEPNSFAAARTMEVCFDYIDNNNLDIEWVLWCSHDTPMIGDDFMQKLEQKLEENPRFATEVGVIGFCDWGTPMEGQAVYGRGILLDGITGPGTHKHECNYKNLPSHNSRDNGKWLQPSYTNAEYFIVEAPQDNIAAFNKKLYQDLIEPDYRFILFNWMDDICAQFGLHGIAAITIPSLEVIDQYRKKPEFKVARSIKSNSKFHKDAYGLARKLPAHWRHKYLYSRPISSRDLGNVRAIFETDEVQAKYKNSIQRNIFEWHIDDGPKTLDDLKYLK
jgi:hypothetical protein